MPDEIVPGPYPESCPPPTQIDCIEVTKVYDFCFLSQTKSPLLFAIPPTCGVVPSGTTGSATVSSVSCTTVSVVPIGTTGFANVTILVTVDLNITLTAPDGSTVCTFPGSFNFFETVVLCAPSGTTITCESPSSLISGGTLVNNEVAFIANICVLIESVATVKLLVPTFGFCVPAPCVVAPAPPFACPPTPLYPPQCQFPPPTSGQGQGGGQTQGTPETPVSGPVV
jgi:hypothetical protein